MNFILCRLFGTLIYFIQVVMILNKKKKYITVILILIICAVAVVLAIKAYKIYSSTLMNKQLNSQQAADKSLSSSENNEKNNKSSHKNITVMPGEPEENNSFQFMDTIHGNNVFLKKDVNDMDGKTVGYITKKLLDEAKIDYTATGTDSILHFSAINGRVEKKAGNLSGWCYYVRKKGESKFIKPDVESGQWIYHTGDTVVWRYVQNSAHDGYSGAVK